MYPIRKEWFNSVGCSDMPTNDGSAFTLQDLAHGLRELLAYEGNVEEDLCTDFQVNLKASWTLFNLCAGAGVTISA